MSGRRKRQIESLLRTELSDIIQRELKDPRLGFASITHVHVSKDMGHARVMVSIYGTDEERKQSIEALQHAQGFIRRQLGPRIRLRRTPALLFELDESLQHAEHISRLLSDLDIQPETDEQEGKEPGRTVIKSSPQAAPPQHEQLADIGRLAPDIRTLIQNATKIAIVTHARVDADAMASLISMRLAAQALDGSCVLSAPGDAGIPDSLDFLAGQLEHQNLDDNIADFDLVIFVDCADQSRAEPLSAQVMAGSPGAKTINIDHHVTNTRFADLNLVVPGAPATAEIITVLFHELGLTIDKRTATALLAGIYGDTLGLKTPSTTPHAMRTSADLVEAGAHLDLIVDHLFRAKPFSTVKLWGEAQRRAAWRGRLVWTLVDNLMLRDAGADATATEGLVNFLAGTIDAFAAAVVQEANDGWRVSLRSTTEGVNVSDIAKRFDGGGHPRAAGCRLGPGPDALEEFLDIVEAILADLPTQANSRTAGVPG